MTNNTTTMDAERYLKSNGYFDSPHFPFYCVAMLLENYAEMVKKELQQTDVSGAFHKGYLQGYNDAIREASEEIKEHYIPNVNR